MATILWLARDFRSLDNAALRAAAAEGPIQAVFLRDKTVAQMGSAARWRLGRALEVFDLWWRERTGQGISVLEGEAEEVLPWIAERLGARHIHQNDWPWAPMQAAQQRLSRALEGRPCKLVLHKGHLLLAPSRLRSGRGEAYRVFTPFAKALRAVGPDRPAPAVGAFSAFPSLGPLSEASSFAPDLRRGAAVLAQWSQPVGEAAALAALERFWQRVGGYPEERDRPDLEATSGLSEALALGEISPRLIWAEAELRRQAHPEQATAIAKFQSEIAWREFAWHLLLDFPNIEREEWKADWRGFPWHGAVDAPEVTDWQQARTGIPLVDAGLREMWVTGRMHNRVRMVVASWLSKHLLTDWRFGLQHFGDCLTDWDPASNAMNWQWVAGCGPDASPFFRIFNPVKQAQDYDPHGRYRRFWLEGEGAAAYRAAAPLSWKFPPLYREDATPERLAQGRARALAVLQLYRDVGRGDLGL